MDATFAFFDDLGQLTHAVVILACGNNSKVRSSFSNAHCYKSSIEPKAGAWWTTPVPLCIKMREKEPILSLGRNLNLS